MKKTVLMTLLTLLAAASLTAFDGYVDITNQTGYTIHYIYVSHAADENWGDDMLGEKYLPDGETHRVYLTGHPSPIFDILVEDEDGDTYTFYEVDVEQQDVIVTLDDLDADEVELDGEATLNGPGGDFDGYVDITNATGFAMHQLKVRQAVKEWGPDLLGGEVLPDGGVFRVNLNNFASGLFDIRLVDEEEDTYTFYDVDVETSDVEVTLDHLD